MIAEESAKAYWMHGGLEQVHIKTRRKRFIMLQIAQEGGQVLVDRRSTGSSRCIEEVLDHATVLKPSRQATPDQPAEDLLLYISCTTHVVSTALVVERAEEGHTYLV
jgi:hypothetical protein